LSKGTGNTAARILIVEDESLLSWSLSKVLGKAGFDITVAETGEKAIEELAGVAFDLVITDLKLPHINGFSVASAVKSSLPGVPVILISALEDRESREMGSAVLVDCFVEKPFDLNEMSELVRKLTGRGIKCQSN